MSTAVNESETELVEKSVSLESAIKPSNEFLQIFKSSHTFLRNRNQFSKKQVRTMQTKMERLYHEATNSGNVTLDDIITLACSYHTLCYAYIESNQKEELRIARDCVFRCLNLIADKELDPKFIFLALKCHNHLGYIYYKQNQTEKAIQTYDKGVELYLTYTQENEKYDCPIDLRDMIDNLSAKLNGYEKLKEVYIFILESLIELHEYIVPNNHRLITCNHLLLVVELSKLSENKEYFDWIDRAMKVCDYLLKHNRFTEARSHIIAAFHVLKMFNDKKHSDMKEQESLSEVISELDREVNNNVTDIINMRWVKIGGVVLRKSRERLLRLEKAEDSETGSLKSKYQTKSKAQVSEKLLLFDEIEKRHPNECQLTMPDYLSGYNDAHILFIKILRYTLQSFSFDHRHIGTDMPFKVNIYAQFILDVCKLFKYMSFYEKDTTHRILLLNRRVHMLIFIAEFLPSIYFNVSRHLRLQLALAYSFLLDVKFEVLGKTHPLFTILKYDVIMFDIKNLMECAVKNLKVFADITIR